MPINIFTTLDDPLAIEPQGTQAEGINGSGQIVGQYRDGNFHGFVLSGGNFITIDDSLATATAPFGINDAGQVVGFYFDGAGAHGFLLSGGRFKRRTIPRPPRAPPRP